MVVDDDPDIAKITTQMLQSAGFHVDHFTNGTEAFERFSQDTSRYALVLTDIRMPAISGIELANAIHDIKPDVVLMLMTAFDKETYDLPPFIKPERVLRKPFSTETVCDSVKMQLKTVI